jgi:hypothetical protein
MTESEIMVEAGAPITTPEITCAYLRTKMFYAFKPLMDEPASEILDSI